MLLGLTVLIQQGRECRAATTSDLPATSAYLDCLTDNIGDGSCDEMNNVAACGKPSTCVRNVLSLPLFPRTAFWYDCRRFPL